MQAADIATRYDPQSFERRIYEQWEEAGAFVPRRPGAGEKPFVIVIPPPNVTGVLHLGHGLNNSIQDILIRYHRMRAIPTLWIPGTDHAGIATQTVVERMLLAEGSSREGVGREAFLSRTWEVKEFHHGIITEQLRRIGASADWSRERFTLDDGLSKAVREVFVRLYEQGLIYRGSYLINWSVGAQTALSDDEVEFKQVNGKMYRLRYPLSDGSGFVEVETTRPETMLGDTAIAVHPDDERFAAFVGKTVTLPLTGREVPVVADDYVDREFGTGAVKITPAHDFNDYELGLRHELPLINILNPDGTLNAEVPEPFRGLSVKQARKAVVAALEEADAFIGSRDYVHQVGHCYRTDTVVEPLLSEQWFVRMQPLAERALAAWENGAIEFHPRRWENTYTHWLRNIRDWCISRQLWWGHRIPVWYDTDSGEVIVSREDPDNLPEYAGRNLVQDEDVLDTWFSSWLWPFSTLGWPDETADLRDFFPTSALVTGYDIIFFWVARMIMASLLVMDEVPFRDIYITGLIRDKQGRKMSKSAGNGIDPLEVVEEYGADALRFTLSFLSALGQDIPLGKDTFAIGSRFANKIWNASRYLLINVEGRTVRRPADGDLRPLDRWIIHQLDSAATAVQQAMADYRFDEASRAVYEYFWNEFCDWYLEGTKPAMQSGDPPEQDRQASVLVAVLDESLRLLHPFLPFVTEELYGLLPQAGEDRGVCISASYPEPDPARRDPELDAGFTAVKDVVRAIRTLRSEFGIDRNTNIPATVVLEEGFAHAAFVRKQTGLMEFLAGATVRTGEAEKAEPGAIKTAVPGAEIAADIRELIDLQAQVLRLQKSLGKLDKQLSAARAKLENPKFRQNADPSVVAQEEEKAAELERQRSLTAGYLTELSGAG